jgi:hypothetical protein
MRFDCRRLASGAATAIAIMAITALPAQAAVFYENLPTNVDIVDHTESRHGVGGPIIADDFMSATGGYITRVEWWGSAARDSRWELAFRADNPLLHQPNVDDPSSGALRKYGEDGSIVAAGVANVPGHPDIFHFTADLPVSLAIAADTVHWFTVANFTQGWHWACALGGTTVGSEFYNAHFSTGIGPCGDGGPHCGPWIDLHTDFAFRVNGVPEPATLGMVGLALAWVAAVARRRKGSEGAEPAVAV